MRSPASVLLGAASVLLALPSIGAAQDAVTISGRVTSAETGVPLNLASVTIEGLDAVALTRNGRYSLVIAAPRGHGQQVTIVARLIGYKAKSATIALAGSVTQDFSLDGNPLRLGEVVVTGAGTTSSMEKLGTVISIVDSSSIERSHESNVVEALAGKSPGVFVNSQSGDPGASSYIRIRGIKSLSDDAQPLFVVDGMPFDNSIGQTVGGDGGAGIVAPNRAADINPNDIESVTILKGASASAIYGARAANGVVLITTRSGHAGGAHYSLSSNFSFESVDRTIPLQHDYAQGNDGITDVCDAPGCRPASSSYGAHLEPGTVTYDHFGEIFEGGHSADNTIAAFGGNDKTTFYLSAGNTTQHGIIVGPSDAYERSTVHVRATQLIIDRLSIGGNFNYVDARGSFIEKGSTPSGLMLTALRTPPAFNNRAFLDSMPRVHRSYRYPRPFSSDDISGRGFDNPFFDIYDDRNTTETNRAYGNVHAELDATDWLKVNYTLGADFYDTDLFFGAAQSTSAGPGGFVLRTTGDNLQVDHNLTATLSHTFDPALSGAFTIGQNLNAQRTLTLDAGGHDLIAAAPFDVQNTSERFADNFKVITHSESYFAQATADIWAQLYLTAALRNDGFSTFGEANPRAWYPKASMSWTFTSALGKSDQKGVLTFGKIRAAYGETGKAPAPYLTNTVVMSGSVGDLNATQQGHAGLFSSGQLGNSRVKPEREKELEGGVDFGFFDQRTDLSLTYYRSNSIGVILELPIPLSSGFGSILGNGAKIRNEGYEASLNIRPFSTKRWSWDVGLQWSKNTTTVLALSGAQFVSGAAQGSGNFGQGAATLGYGFGLRGVDFVRCGRGLSVGTDSIDADVCHGAPKNALYIGDDGFPVLDPTDRVVSDPDPHWTGSIQTSLHVRHVTFSALIDHKQGGDIWNGTRGALDHYGTHKDTDIRGRTFTFGRDFPYVKGPVVGPGAGTSVVIDESWFQNGGSGFNGPITPFIEDGTYTKIRELSIGYSFDAAWVSRLVGLRSIDLKLAGRNLYTWTKYSGIDPETNLAGAEFAIQGIDFFNNPQTRSIVVSIVLNR
jgi:TonB-linked SusC/RagA family outer membrane protein